MSVRKADDFVADIERPFDWYFAAAGWDVANRYLDAVEVTCRLLQQRPNLGPRAGFTHPRLKEWRFFLLSRPLNQHILFYELAGTDVVMRRTMRGQRDLPRRLLEAPGPSDPYG
jgi:plasmid stabilization system protein ParE